MEMELLLERVYVGTEHGEVLKVDGYLPTLTDDIEDDTYVLPPTLETYFGKPFETVNGIFPIYLEQAYMTEKWCLKQGVQDYSKGKVPTIFVSLMGQLRLKVEPNTIVEYNNLKYHSGLKGEVVLCIQNPYNYIRYNDRTLLVRLVTLDECLVDVRYRGQKYPQRVLAHVPLLVKRNASLFLSNPALIYYGGEMVLTNFLPTNKGHNEVYVYGVSYNGEPNDFHPEFMVRYRTDELAEQLRYAHGVNLKTNVASLLVLDAESALYIKEVEGMKAVVSLNVGMTNANKVLYYGKRIDGKTVKVVDVFGVEWEIPVSGKEVTADWNNTSLLNAATYTLNNVKDDTVTFEGVFNRKTFYKHKGQAIDEIDGGLYYVSGASGYYGAVYVYSDGAILIDEKPFIYTPYETDIGIPINGGYLTVLDKATYTFSKALNIQVCSEYGVAQPLGYKDSYNSSIHYTDNCIMLDWSDEKPVTDNAVKENVNNDSLNNDSLPTKTLYRVSETHSKMAKRLGVTTTLEEPLEYKIEPFNNRLSVITVRGLANIVVVKQREEYTAFKGNMAFFNRGVDALVYVLYSGVVQAIPLPAENGKRDIEISIDDGELDVTPNLITWKRTNFNNGKITINGAIIKDKLGSVVTNPVEGKKYTAIFQDKTSIPLTVKSMYGNEVCVFNQSEGYTTVIGTPNHTIEVAGNKSKVFMQGALADVSIGSTVIKKPEPLNVDKYLSIGHIMKGYYGLVSETGLTLWGNDLPIARDTIAVCQMYKVDGVTCVNRENIYVFDERASLNNVSGRVVKEGALCDDLLLRPHENDKVTIYVYAPYGCMVKYGNYHLTWNDGCYTADVLWQDGVLVTVSNLANSTTLNPLSYV